MFVTVSTSGRTYGIVELECGPPLTSFRASSTIRLKTLDFELLGVIYVGVVTLLVKAFAIGIKIFDRQKVYLIVPSEALKDIFTFISPATEKLEISFSIT